MPSPWVRWSCTKCDVGVSLRANSKGGAPWHHCYRQRGKWMPLTKETNDQTNPGGGGPAGSSPGSDARTERSNGHAQRKRRSEPSIYDWCDPIGPNADDNHAAHDPYVVANCAHCINDPIKHGWLVDVRRFFCGATDNFYRDALARSGGFGSYEGFLAWCGWVCGD